MSQELDNHVLGLIKQKGLYPYENMSDFEKFKEELPSKEICYSSLTGKKISGKECKHDLNVWNKFEMKSMKDYHDFYLKCDVLPLADDFEKFRNNYGLCPSHYLSTPALSWDAKLNMAKVELELITDPDMYIFIEKCMNGGISYISNRYILILYF